MNPKLKIDGKTADRQYNLRTTDYIIEAFAEEATSRGVSVNVLINKTLLPAAKKFKTKITKPSK